MIPAGYLYKKVASQSDWLKPSGIVDVLSVSGCISEHFTRFEKFWRNNGYGLFNSPRDAQSLAQEEHVGLSGMRLFYYEVHEEMYDDEERVWLPTSVNEHVRTDVRVASRKKLQGYDVVCTSHDGCISCSPLSCNGVANEIAVNAHCLFDNFADAKQMLEAGKFDNSEPGPFAIFAVYTVEPE